jgi:hypothetical protein
VFAGWFNVLLNDVNTFDGNFIQAWVNGSNFTGFTLLLASTNDDGVTFHEADFSYCWLGVGWFTHYSTSGAKLMILA